MERWDERLELDRELRPLLTRIMTEPGLTRAQLDYVIDKLFKTWVLHPQEGNNR